METTNLFLAPGAPRRDRPNTAGPATARRVAHLGAEARALRHDIVTWALAAGRTVDFDALTVVLACRAELAGPLTRFTCEDVWRLWWLDLSQWCADRRVAVPQGLAASMTTVFAFLDAVDGFAPGSDDLEDLVDAMEQAGALWRGGRTPVGAG